MVMDNDATNPGRRPAGPAANDDAGGGLPLVTSRERDFWRRAVAEERARLELTGHAGAAGPQTNVH
jgi:hypothetical protein